MCEEISTPLLPWQMPYNGITWQDMPGIDDEDKKLNHALMRHKIVSFIAAKSAVDNEAEENATAEQQHSERRTPKVFSVTSIQGIRRAKELGIGYLDPRSAKPRRWPAARRNLIDLPDQQRHLMKLARHIARMWGWLHPYARLATACGVSSAMVYEWSRECAAMSPQWLEIAQRVMDEIENERQAHFDRAARIQQLWLEARGPREYKNGALKELCRLTGMANQLAPILEKNPASFRPESLNRIEPALQAMLSERARWEVGGGIIKPRHRRHTYKTHA